jgi:predicted MFS family arabinose efflux permease
VWGWRVPFLLAIVTLVAAMALRYNMPESREVRQQRWQRQHTSSTTGAPTTCHQQQ